MDTKKEMDNKDLLAALKLLEFEISDAKRTLGTGIRELKYLAWRVKTIRAEAVAQQDLIVLLEDKEQELRKLISN